MKEPKNDPNLLIAREILDAYAPARIAQEWPSRVREELAVAVRDLLAAGWPRMSLELPHRLKPRIDEGTHPREVFDDLWQRILKIRSEKVPDGTLVPTVGASSNPWGVAHTEVVQYRSCGRGDCTGGGNSPGTGGGDWRQRFGDDGFVTGYCDTAVIDRDGIQVPCHPSAGRIVFRPVAPRVVNDPDAPRVPTAPRVPPPDPSEDSRAAQRAADARRTGFCYHCAHQNVAIPALAVTNGLCNTCKSATMEIKPS